jgi:hypothetical protein
VHKDQPPPTVEAGSLVVVGTGIKAIGQVTLEAEAHIRQAEKLFYLAADSVTEHWLQRTNLTAESLYGYYGTDKDRGHTYEQIIDRLVSAVRSGIQVCCALYGHPGVFAYPGREAVRRLQGMGFDARLLPGVSAEDCIFADLGIDPGTAGCQSFEATDFLIRKRRFDPYSLLILWQVALIGIQTTPSEPANRKGLEVLTERLVGDYAPTHTVIIYQASPYALCESRVTKIDLADLPTAAMTPISTLVVPPVAEAECDAEVIRRLGIVR